MGTNSPNVKDDYIRVRTNRELKKKATEIVEGMQLDLSTVINMTLDQIIRHNGLPFEVTNDDQRTIQLRKLQAELAKGTDAAKQGKTKVIDEVRDLFTSSDKG
jgi:DNA-damage-inducible protein J